MLTIVVCPVLAKYNPKNAVTISEPCIAAVRKFNVSIEHMIEAIIDTMAAAADIAGMTTGRLPLPEISLFNPIARKIRPITIMTW